MQEIFQLLNKHRTAEIQPYLYKGVCATCPRACLSVSNFLFLAMLAAVG